MRTVDLCKCSDHLNPLQVDWSRFHLQLLFVDDDDGEEARMAQSLFDAVSEWNGYGRALYGWTCGVDCGADSTRYSPERAISLMVEADRWQTSDMNLGAKVFARPPEQLELHDMYTYDVVICMNRKVKERVFGMFEPDLALDWENEVDRDFYRQRVCTLADFLEYASSLDVSESGGRALLPSQISDKLGEVDLQHLRNVGDIPTAELENPEQWNEMVMCTMLGIAGLVKYLIDTYPEDLHQFWLE